MPETVTHWPADLTPENCPIYSWNELTTDAPIEHIWAWLIRCELWPTFYSNARRVRIEAGPERDLALGTHFRWITFGVPVRTVVEEFEPFRRLSWRGSGLGAAGYHSWIFEENQGQCRMITEEVQTGLVPSLGRFALRRGLLFFHQRWLEGLAEKAKGGAPPA